MRQAFNTAKYIGVYSIRTMNVFSVVRLVLLIVFCIFTMLLTALVSSPPNIRMQKRRIAINCWIDSFFSISRLFFCEYESYTVVLSRSAPGEDE
jgi:hypothetical protein